MATITLTPFHHRNADQIAIGFEYDDTLKSFVKKINGVLWSQTHRTFYVLHTKGQLHQLFTYFKEKGYYVNYSAFQQKNSKQVAPKKQWSKPDSTTLYQQLPLTHKEVLKRYVSYLKGKRLSEQTIKSYAYFVLRFLHFRIAKDITLWSNADLDKYMSEVIAKENYSISSHRQCVGALKYLTALCRVSGFDASTYKRPKKSRYLPTVLSMEETIRLIQVTKNLKHRTIIALLYSSGLRIGELLHLRVKDIDVYRNQVFVKNGKGRKDRVVTLAESIKPLLSNYINTYKPINWFIEGRDGQAYSDSSIRKFLGNSCKQARIIKSVSPHTLRHSYATHMLENGVDIRYIQELLGHSKPETTMIYTHVAQKDLAKISNPLDIAVEQITKTANTYKKVTISRQ